MADSHERFYYPNAHAYMQYYTSQAGAGDISKFHGQAGFGLGSWISGLFRSIVPIGRSAFHAVRPVAKTAFKIAKPHLKAAASELTSEAARRLLKHFGSNDADEGQTGTGYRRATKRRTSPATAKRATKRKQVGCGGRAKRNKTTGKRRSTTTRGARKRASTTTAKRRRAVASVYNTISDIF